MSASKMGHVVSVETRAKLAKAATGRVPSAETRANYSAARMGHSTSAEARAKMSVSHKGRSHATWKSPKPFTEQHRERLSKSHKGHVTSAETRAKLSAVRLGRPRPEMRGRKQSPETIAKRSAAAIGRRPTPETRAKLSASAIRAREDGRQHIQKSHRYTKLAQALHRYLSSRGFTVDPEVRFGRYTVDLYDREHHIAHEADGKFWHAKNEAKRPGYHAHRDEYLHARHGLPVMRYSDTEIRYLSA